MRPGDRLPTVRALALKLAVSPTTVAAAYRVMHSRGMLSSEGRRGTVVSQGPPLVTRPAAPVPPGVRNLSHGSPDPDLLPRLGPTLSHLEPAPRSYGERANLQALVQLAARGFEADGIPAGPIAVVGGAMDGIERLLGAHLRPGDSVAVEDPGYPSVFDLVRALGLNIKPLAVDDFGPQLADLERVLRSGADALVVTPRAHNPTGGALDERRATQLRRVLRAHPEVLLIEDDHAGPVAGVPMVTLADPARLRWAVIRSVSKSLGPDLRTALVIGDQLTIGRVEGRQSLGTGWVSHVLQHLVAALLADEEVEQSVRRAARAYAQRREALLAALASRGIAAHGRSGFNVWIPVAEEVPVVQAMLEAGWAVAAGERFRFKSPPAIRITIANLPPSEAERVTADLARILAPQRRVRTA